MGSDCNFPYNAAITLGLNSVNLHTSHERNDIVPNEPFVAGVGRTGPVDADRTVPRIPPETAPVLLPGTVLARSHVAESSPVVPFA